MLTCPECGSEYQRLSQHWAMLSDYPDIPDRFKEIFTGLLMGDGCISRTKPTPSFTISMVNQEFLEWLSDELQWMAYDVHLSQTAEESAGNTSGGFIDNPRSENFSDVYRLQSPSHPWFEKLADWYQTGKKRFPDDLVLTPMQAKMWYVSDGTLHKHSSCRKLPSASISCLNESDRPDLLRDLFEGLDFTPNVSDGRIDFTVTQTEKFLDWMGKPPLGFHYKWFDEWDLTTPPWQNKDHLERLYVQQGMSLQNVADELGCSPSTVSKWLREYSLPVADKTGEI